MATTEELFELAVSELIKISQLPADDRKAWLQSGADGSLPPMFTAPDGRTFFTTRAGAGALRDLILSFRESDEDLRSKIDKSTLLRLGHRAFGDILLRIEDETPTSTYVDQMRHAIQKSAGDLKKPYHHYVPCQLFLDDTYSRPFAIGPVRFIPRNVVLGSNHPSAVLPATPWTFLSKDGEPQSKSEWEEFENMLSGHLWVAWTTSEDEEYVSA